jgi:hypothetical protein
MVHIRLDDNRIELKMGEPQVGTDDEAQVRLDAGQEKGTLAITMAGRQLRFSDSRTTGSIVLGSAVGIAAAPLDWECPTIGGNRAALSTESPMLATHEAAAERVSEEPGHRLRAPVAHIGHGEHSSVVGADDSYSSSCGIERRESDWFVATMDSTNVTWPARDRDLGDRALSSDTAVRFRGAKVIFRSEPEFVDADGATDLLVIQDC